MALGKHQYLGKNEGKMSRFLSKLTTPKERGQMRKLKEKKIGLGLFILTMENRLMIPKNMSQWCV